MTSDGIRSYTWSARNQLTAIGTTAFQYDGYSRRSQNGAGVSFVYDGLNPVQEIVGGSVRANLVTGGLDEYFARTDSGGTSSFITDALGSTLALADSTGTVQTQYTFDPFGNTTLTGTSSTNAFQYTGRENDGSGIYYYRARYYNATLQRFISEDPLGFGGGDANLYAYVGNSPISYADPLGLCPFCILFEDPIVPIPPELINDATDFASRKQSLPMPDGGRLDLTGKPHVDPSTQQPIPTPHVHDPLPPYEGDYSNYPRGLNRIPRPATPEDFQNAIKHNRPPGTGTGAGFGPGGMGGRKDKPKDPLEECFRLGLCA
ncbi:MAG TPA: RHS repeat-associated core domain-containing protein [Bryobacteraceae bacterium]|nr:RHS repeat-associated core domain-containing protein [Bryobacteraceae bacterium]